MRELVVFGVGAVLALMLLGHLLTPPKERLPVREWSRTFAL